MDQSAIYGQQDFNLPHDDVKLPSKGVFYKPKKESLKVGYLTAYDENILMTSENVRDGLVMTLLKNKIYEPGFDVLQLLYTDVQSILIFLNVQFSIILSKLQKLIISFEMSKYSYLSII